MPIAPTKPKQRPGRPGQRPGPERKTSPGRGVPPKRPGAPPGKREPSRR